MHIFAAAALAVPAICSIAANRAGSETSLPPAGGTALTTHTAR